MTDELSRGRSGLHMYIGQLDVVLQIIAMYYSIQINSDVFSGMQVLLRIHHEVQRDVGWTSKMRQNS